MSKTSAISIRLFFHMERLDPQPIAISVKQNILAQALSFLTRLDPLAPSRTLPQSLDEAYSTAFGLRTIVLAKNRLDSIGSFVCVVERYGGYEMM